MMCLFSCKSVVFLCCAIWLCCARWFIGDNEPACLRYSSHDFSDGLPSLQSNKRTVWQLGKNKFI
jgi:hypothetical protein